MPRLHSIHRELLTGGEGGATICGALRAPPTVTSVELSTQPQTTVLQLPTHSL